MLGDRLIQRRRQQRLKGGRIKLQGIALVLGGRIGIGQAGQRFAHAAFLLGNVLDTVHDPAGAVRQQDIAVAAHQLGPQGQLVPDAQLIGCREAYLQNALHAGLGDGEHGRAGEPLAQQHAEHRGLQRICLALRGDEHPRMVGGSRHDQAVVFILAPDNEVDLILFRLQYLFNAAAGQQLVELPGQRAQGHPIQGHWGSHPLK